MHYIAALLKTPFGEGLINTQLTLLYLSDFDLMQIKHLNTYRYDKEIAKTIREDSKTVKLISLKLNPPKKHKPGRKKKLKETLIEDNES